MSEQVQQSEQVDVEQSEQVGVEPSDQVVTPEHPVEQVIAEIAKTKGDRGPRKVREGYVVSDKMDKTIVVSVEDRVKHKLYGKVLRQTSRLKAHDENNTAGVGDRVIVMETRPLSATKRWRLVTVIEKAR
jgi:small subunit ribosomal protein S17